MTAGRETGLQPTGNGAVQDGHNGHNGHAPELLRPAHDTGMLSALSNQMVALYKAQFGRGPTKSRSNWAGPDALLVTLEDSLTPAERNLVAMDEHARLRDIRTFFQYATEDQFVGIVEDLTGRKVRAFVSGIDTNSDVCSEVFYFDPLS